VADAHLRRMARLFEDTGDPADGARWLAEHARVHDLDEGRLSLALSLGCAAAIQLVPPAVDAKKANASPLEVLNNLRDALRASGEDVAARAMLGDALSLLDELSDLQLSDLERSHLRLSRVRLEASQAILLSPERERAAAREQERNPKPARLAWVLPRLSHDGHHLLERAVDALEEHVAGSHLAFHSWWEYRCNRFWPELFWHGDPPLARARLAAFLAGEPQRDDLSCLAFLRAVAAEVLPFVLGTQDLLQARASLLGPTLAECSLSREDLDATSDPQVGRCATCRRLVMESALDLEEARARAEALCGRPAVRLYRRRDGALQAGDCWEAARAPFRHIVD
jgi:hypothetical protein